jgi:hypothetical protein
MYGQVQGGWCLTWVQLTQLQAMSRLDKYRRWIRNDPNNVGVQNKSSPDAESGVTNSRSCTRRKLRRNILPHWELRLRICHNYMKGSQRTNPRAEWRDPNFCSADLLSTSIRTGFYRSTFTESISFPSLSAFVQGSHESVSFTSCKLAYTSFNRSDTGLIHHPED